MLDLVGQDALVVAPRHAYHGSIGQLGDLEARGRIRATLVDIADTDAVIAALDDAAILWIESPTNPALEVADVERLVAAGHEAGAPVVVDNTFATPLLQQPLELGADIVLHSVTKFLAGHSDVVMGALVVRDDQLYDVLKGRRDLVGAIPGTLGGLAGAARPAHPAPARRALAGQRRRARPPPRGTPRRRPRSATRASARVIAAVLPTAEAADLLTHSTSLWVHATSLGSVESTFERRRRWKTEAATIPEGLVRMSVGIEDVDDLWADLEQALRNSAGRAVRPATAERVETIGETSHRVSTPLAGARAARPTEAPRVSRSRPWCRGR